MPHESWTALTHLGNSTLLLPAALLLALWLLHVRQWSLARDWLAAFGGAVALVLASKLAFMGWGLGIAAWDFTGISGHATVATGVFTFGAWLLAAHGPRREQALALGAGLLVGVLVGVSRLELQVHSVSEVVAGCALGAAAAGWPVWRAAGPRPRLHRRWVPAMLAAVLGLVPQLGRPAEPHGLVLQIALMVSGRGEVYTRHILHRPGDGAP